MQRHDGLAQTSERVVRLQQLMRRDGVDVGAVGLGSSMRYLTGFTDEPGERLFLLLVPASGQLRVIMPKMYEAQARGWLGAAECHTWDDTETPDLILASVLSALGAPRRVMVDDMLWSRFVLMLQDSSRGAEFVSASSLMSELRIRKEATELSALREAALVADTALSRLAELELCGLTESEIAVKLEGYMRSEGADGLSFSPIIASGPNSAFPHHRAGRRRIRPGDAIVIDFGCTVDGYCSDVTRTVACVTPPQGFVEVYGAVSAAHHAALGSVRPGVKAKVVDISARGAIEKHGLGEYFTHRTGHGIGLDLHEAPDISAVNEVELVSGMVFSIEPGVYIEGEFGVRIEDIVAMTDDGPVLLNHAPRELLVVS